MPVQTKFAKLAPIITAYAFVLAANAIVANMLRSHHSDKAMIVKLFAKTAGAVSSTEIL